MISEADYARSRGRPFSPPSPIQVAFFDEGNNYSNNLEDPLTDDANNFIHALGGNDTVISGAGDGTDRMEDDAMKLALTR